MKHPLNKASEVAPFLIEQMKEIIEDSPGHLMGSEENYKKTLKRVNRRYKTSIQGTFMESWEDRIDSLSKHSDSFDEDHAYWDKEQFLAFYDDFYDSLHLMKKRWSSLLTAIEDLDDKTGQSPQKSQYTRTCRREIERITESSLSLLEECRDHFMGMVGDLESIGVREFKLGISHNVIRLLDCNIEVGADEDSTQWERTLSRIEWFGMILPAEISQPHLHLNHCRFVQCSFSGIDYTGVQWSDVHLHQCSGQFGLSDSNVSLSTTSSPFQSMNFSRTTIASLNINGSNVSKIDIHTNSSVAAFNVIDSEGITGISIASGGPTAFNMTGSSCEVLNLMGQEGTLLTCSIDLKSSNIESILTEYAAIERVNLVKVEGCTFRAVRSPIGSMILAQSKDLYLKLEQSGVESLSSVESNTHIESNSSFIREQLWDKSNACIITQDSPVGRCQVTLGQHESHRLTRGSRCQLVFSKQGLVKDPSPHAGSYGKMGRILRILNIRLHDEASFKEGTLLEFYHSQLLCLLKHGVDVSNSHLESAIGDVSGVPSDVPSFYESVLESFRMKTLPITTKRPVESSVAIQSLGQADKQFFLDNLHANDDNVRFTHSSDNPTTADLDANFCHHLVKTMGLYGPFGGRKIFDGRLSRMKRETNQLINRYMSHQGVTAHLLSEILTVMRKARLKRRRSNTDHIINYLVRLTSWYLDMRLKSEECVNDLKRIMYRSSEVGRLNQALRRDNPLISAQMVSKMHASNRMHRDEVDSNFFDAYSQEMGSEKWASFKETDSINMRLALEHTKAILMQYKPMFARHPKGAKKVAIIRQLIGLINAIPDGIKAKNLQTRLTAIHRHIDHLLTGDGQLDSERLFPASVELSRGNSRSVSGYVTTLTLAQHLLDTVMKRKHFLRADLDRSGESDAYFQGKSSVDLRVKEMLRSKARRIIRERLGEIEEEVRRQWDRNDCLSDKISLAEDITLMNLTQQLETSEQLLTASKDMESWREGHMLKLLSLHYHYQQRENSGLKTVHSIQIRNGEFTYRYKQLDRNIAGQPVTNDSVELVNLADIPTARKLSQERSVRKVSVLLNRAHGQDGVLFAEAAQDIKIEGPG